MSAIDTLPPLREVIANHQLSARKSLGQNFLLDLNLTAKIARQAGDLTECDVLEIGPGPGGLTRGLLSEGARKVVAVEKDTRCIAALNDIARAGNMSRLAREAGMSREGLYKALSEDGNPSFATVMRITRALGLHVRITV